MSSQCSTFGPLLFLKYINNLTEELPNAKLFAGDTLLFSVVCNINTSADEVSNDLVKINKWAYQWKMSFNSDPTKLQRKLHNILPRSTLLTIYKGFVTSLLDYGNIYDQAYNATFHQKLELIQNNASLH